MSTPTESVREQHFGQTVAMSETEPPSPSNPGGDLPEPADMPTSVLYVAAVDSFLAFARTLTDEQWSTPVPCLPGWDVRDVLSHVAGIPDDAFAGRMEGAPGEAWTASQVERNRDLATAALLDRWAEQYVAFGDVLDGIGEHRPPFDCHAHEHDIRQALDLAGNRDSLVVEAAAVQLARGFEPPTPVTIQFVDGRSFTTGNTEPANVDGAVSVRGISAFEIFRSRLGRRSRSQVEAYDWSGDDAAVSEVIDAWFQFGPADGPVLEDGELN